MGYTRMTTPDTGSNKSIFITNIIGGIVLPFIYLIVFSNTEYSNSNRGSIRIRGYLIGSLLTLGVFGIVAASLNENVFGIIIGCLSLLGAIILFISTLKRFFIRQHLD
jgi:hypothetical protein